MYCNVLVELAHVFIDKVFTYKIPNNLIDKVKVGMRVRVLFAHQELEGFVMEIISNTNRTDILEIIDIVDEYPILNKELLNLGKYISKKTLSSLMSSYQVMLPKGLKAKAKVNINKKYDKYIILNKKIDLNTKLNNKQQEIINILSNKDKVLLKDLKDISISSVNTLIKKGYIKVVLEEVSRIILEDNKKGTYVLNDEQKEVFEQVVRDIDCYNTYLLHGVTGSGKTNVYMKLIEEVIKRGKKAIVLVPEISLTPQIINRFKSLFDRIAILHSGLSDGEKYDEWLKIKEDKVDIVIGARSAIFAPFTNIGIIIVDEEHSSTYKQENTPRYNAIDIAIRRAKYHNCPLILGSATPSLESFAKARKNIYKLLTLSKKYNNNPLNIKIIDMNKEFKKANGYLSKPLVEKIKEKINLNQQVILFLNKRGYSSYITCSNCGYTDKCPNCDISLTYHKSSNMLRCHYCGYASKRLVNCKNCNEKLIEYGLGTERLVEEILKVIDNAKVIRMDVDTTTKKGSHKRIINDFEKGKYNILVGTQMIAKGLDFPNVTLVGIIDADKSLNFPDFRSSEITFSLLNQVAGRSGRKIGGDVLIQTFNKDHYAIKYCLNNDYIGFYNEEMTIRKKLKYPPYYYICLIRIISKDYDLASKESIKIGDYLKNNIKEDIILGPSIANIFKLNNNYRFQVIIKYKDINTIYKYLEVLQRHYFNNKKIKLEIDFNPLKM